MLILFALVNGYSDGAIGLGSLTWKDSSSLVFVDNPIYSYELSRCKIMIYFSILLIFYLVDKHCSSA